MINGELKSKRKSLKINQASIGKKLKCSEKQFRRYENGECIVPFDKALLWAKTLGLSINQFTQLYNKEEK